jgi:hypothetical protein
MPTNLTASKINATYSQLLHVDGGPDATEKVVYSGTGVGTALRVGVSSVSVGNVRLSGNQVSAISGNVELANVAITSGTITGISPIAVAVGGTGASDAAAARTNLGLGTIATQDASSVAITGGAISNVTLSSVSVPFASLSGRAYASFYDAGTSAQTGSVTDRTAVKWATASVSGSGITVASNSRITLAVAGTYRFNISLQIDNSDGSERDVDIWFAKNGTNIASSNSRVSVPAANSGGTLVFAIELFDTVAANDYIEVYWHPSSTGVTLLYRAAVAASPGVTPAIPATPPAIVVVERIA